MSRVAASALVEPQEPLLPAYPLLYAPFGASVENDNLVMSPSNAFGLAFVYQMGLELQKRDARSQSMMCSSDAATPILDVPVLSEMCLQQKLTFKGGPNL